VIYPGKEKREGEQRFSCTPSLIYKIDLQKTSLWVSLDNVKLRIKLSMAVEEAENDEFSLLITSTMLD
jgi:hypothetical protein